MVKLRTLFRMVITFVLAATHSQPLLAQSIPDVPSELLFAGVSVYLSEPGRARVQQELRQLYLNRRQLEQDMDALRQLTPSWQPYLTEANLPADLRYVALPFAGSNEGAYWAIRSQQAANLRLRIDAVVDERLHPLVATEATVGYLKRMQEAYRTNAVQTLLYYLQNDPPRPITEPTQQVAQTVLLDVNSAPLIWKILARKLAVEREEPAYRPAMAYVLYAYRDGGGQTLTDMARRLGLSIERFNPYNTWLKAIAVPPDNDYPVLIRLTPDEFPAIQRLSLASTPQSAALPRDTGFPVLRKVPTKEQGLRSAAVLYSVNELRGVQAQACDNAITLAFYGDIPVKSFLAYNELGEQDVIRPGEIYYLEEKAKRAKVPYHVVQRNQSLRDVSNMYGVRLSSLLRFNGVQPTQRIRAGRILWLQRKRPRNRPVEYQQLPVEEPAPPVRVPDSIKTTVQPVPADTTRQPVAQLAPAEPRPTPIADTALVAKTPPAPQKPVEPAPAVPERTNKPEAGIRIHVVKPGQTYYGIARLYGVTVNQLYFWNNLSERIPLEVGQELVVAPNPRRVATPAPPPSVRPTPNRPVTGVTKAPESSDAVYYHVVKPGQTVYRVALINKVSVADVMRWNGLNDYTIEVGQRLIIRKPQ